jgi:hypothetical protein
MNLALMNFYFHMEKMNSIPISELSTNLMMCMKREKTNLKIKHLNTLPFISIAKTYISIINRLF